MDASKYVRSEGNLCFGLNQMQALAAELRALAFGIESGRVEVKRIETKETAIAKDFPISTITLTYCEFIPPLPSPQS